MASSNRHWPSMFKSKPCNHNEFNSPHYSSTPCKSNPFPSIGDGSTMEERTPEPKPRWNPKPEQIRILEAIFNSGMVNPPREEIKKIRAQLQEYGQVGDANVFYWFQNRKSRSKQKNRQLLHNSSVKSTVTNPITPQTPPLAAVAPSSSSSSSSDRSSPNNKGPISKLDISNSQNYTNFNEPYLHHEVAAPPPPSGLPFFFPVQQNGSVVPGLCFNEYMGSGGGGDGGGFSSFSSEVVNPVMSDQNSMGSFSDMLLGDMPRRMFEDESFLVTNPTNIPPTSSSLMLPNSISHLQGTVDPPSVGRLVAKSTVFINDVSFEVPALGPFNVREAFGEDVVLVHQSGHPVPTTDWGLTLHPLQHGACYFLARSVASSKHHGSFASAPHDFLPPSEYPFNL